MIDRKFTAGRMTATTRRRIATLVVELSAEESTEYWKTRPRGSQLAAWASPQSRPLESRSELDALVSGMEERSAGVVVPRPPFWGGYRLVPETVELWVHRDDRLHDRVSYTRGGSGWRSERLAP